MKRTLALVLTVIVFTGSLSSPISAGQSPTADAQRSAETWLALADLLNYEGSWDIAATYFKNQVSLEQWEQALRGARAPLGEVESRTLKSATPATSLPGAPDGNYVVMEFDTRFEHKRDGVETVTALRESDGIWRVVGYFIR